jgi:MoxR-like ATPase
VNHHDKIREALRVAGKGLVEREALCELIALAAVAREHLLIIGPPGTAKSEAVRRMSKALGAKSFEYLLGRFTEPNEIFGPVDLAKLREGIVETRTEGMLPEAELAFLDEVFLGSTAILNTLLGMLNERVYRRGHTNIKTPLRVCVGASNSVPEDEALAAFGDRFVLRLYVEPIGDPMLEDLLVGGWGLTEVPVVAGVEDLDALAAQVKAADPSGIRPHLSHAVRKLRKAGIVLSDRRVVKCQKLACAAAVLDGRANPGPEDLWPIVYAVPTPDGQKLARDTLRDLLATCQNKALASAAAEASLGPAARAARILEHGWALLETPPETPDEGWLLKVEGIAREIDAGFSTDELPEELATLRSRVVDLLGSG